MKPEILKTFFLNDFYNLIYAQHSLYSFLPTSLLQDGHIWTLSLQSFKQNGKKNKGVKKRNIMRQTHQVFPPALYLIIVLT